MFNELILFKMIEKLIKILSTKDDYCTDEIIYDYSDEIKY
jgi:hypothetical protein